MTTNEHDVFRGSLEEISSEGEGAGLEVERTTEEDINAPFDPKLIDVITQQRTVDLLVTRLRHGELDLSPDFQRRANLWGEVQKSSLIESMLLRIPIPSLYMSEDEDGNYAVVDGLQRLCAIAHFVEVASLNKAFETKFVPLRLKGLVSLAQGLQDKAFDELPRALQRRIRETELTLHVIRAGTPSDVKFNIFSRINRGGLPLRAQEIRNAIYNKGKWKHYVRTMAASPVFLQVTEGKIKGERMEDHELVLRFLAHFSLPAQQDRHPDQNLDEFLNDFVEKGSVSWADSEWQRAASAFQRGLIAATQIFGPMAFRKYSPPGATRRPINRGLFETQTVALARRSAPELQLLAERSSDVVTAFGEAFLRDREFENALLYATGRGSSSNKRLEVMDGIFDQVLQNA